MIARGFMIVAVLASLPRLAAADERHASLTIEPVLLVLPMVDASVELSPTPYIGIVADAGYGHMFLPINNSMYDLGGQGNVYLQRPFDGPHLGVEMRWMWGGASIPFASGADSMSDVHERIAGIYAGWKWIGWKGLTAILQLGVGHLDLHSTCACNDPQPPESKLIPVGNFTAGYSF